MNSETQSIQTPFERIKELLERHQVWFELETHDTAITSMDVVQMLNGFAIENGAKSIVFKLKDEFKLVVVRGDNRADYNKLRKYYGSRKIRLATPEEVYEVMGVEVGACYPFGEVAGLDMIVDESLQNRDIIHFSPGTHYDHISMKMNDYTKIVQPTFVDVI